MDNFHEMIVAVRETEPQEEGEYVRRARQHEDLQHLYEAIEWSSEKRNDGWRAIRGEMHEVILKRKGRIVGEWSRAGAGFVFRYPGEARSPVRAVTFQDLSQRTAEIIAAHPSRSEWRLARLMGLGPKGA